MVHIMNETMVKLCKSGSGILAADESNGTMAKRLQAINVEANPLNRCEFRNLLFTSEGMKKYISGVILYDETIRQKNQNNVLLTEVIKSQDCLIGIKVDMGVKPLASDEDGVETYTDGLTGLDERLKEYFSLGVRFAKWRSVFVIDVNKSYPSDEAIAKNIDDLGKYALLCQNNNIVPIVEPEVLMTGDHNIDVCQQISTKIIKQLFVKLDELKVDVSKIVLKPNMVIEGEDCQEKAKAETVAKKTLQSLQEACANSLKIVAFLSGGQSELRATENLNMINKLGHNEKFFLTFSYGRALQASTLRAWQGKSENQSKAQTCFTNRALMNSQAQQAKWQEADELHSSELHSSV